MKDERWLRIETLVLGVLELEGDDRRAFLDEACSDDEPLRHEVEEIVRAHERTGLGVEKLLTRLRAEEDAESDGAPQALVEALADRYLIERELGAGGMAFVYLAADLRHHRKVAIKVLRPAIAETLGPERFLREIEIAASLTHPHILPLHDSGEAAGFLYYVMPFIEGESLGDRLEREERLPIDDSLRLLREVASALAEAHSRSVVHRDIKPDNVLLSAGHALVADFGIAKAVREASAAPIEKARAVDVADKPAELTQAGVSIGTPRYMAPEQAAAEDVDQRADLFSLGAIAYEMLTGSPAFTGKNTRALLAAVLADTPESPHAVDADIPEPLSQLVMRCLEKDRADRPQSAEELIEALDEVTASLARWRPSRFQIAAAAIVVLAGGVGAWWLNSASSAERRARDSIRTVETFLAENRLREAADLAFEIEEVLGPDSLLAPLWDEMTTPYRVTSDPPGATILARPYEIADAEWRVVGTTPFETDRFPVGAFRFRLELAGYEPVEVARSLLYARHATEIRNAGWDYLDDASYVLDATLSPIGELPVGMIAVSGGLFGTIPVLGFGAISPRPIPPFYIDRTEVTNAAFQEFIEAGAYDDRSVWQMPFEREGTQVPFELAMSSFVDGTGLPGPSSWSGGAPAPGEEQFPVGGVSWFEAEAYCRWRGKSLPTLYHWARATLPSTDSWVPFNPHLVATSNFGGEGLAPAGSTAGIGISGAVDLAGNVREWVSTGRGDARYLMGGAWSDPNYILFDPFEGQPWRRFQIDGFRCALYPEEAPVPPELLAPREAPQQDLSVRGTLSDEAFELTRRFHAYDTSQELLPRDSASVELPWGAIQQWVSVTTPYGERMQIRITLPADPALEPPYQSVVYFPGGNTLRSTVLEQPPLEFVVQSGRAVVEPVYDGTFLRNVGQTVQRWSVPESRRDLIRHWVQDLGRTIDFLEEDPRFDGDGASFVGMSLGGALVPNLIAFEPRFRTTIILSGGFDPSESQESVDLRVGYAERITMPVLMLGGANDFTMPVRGQAGLFDAFGTPADRKRHVVYDSGHWPMPQGEVARETLQWLDMHVGPVSGSP